MRDQNNQPIITFSFLFIKFLKLGMMVIPALGRLRWEDGGKVEANLSYTQ